MNRREAIRAFLALGVASVPLAAQAQPAGKVPTVGVVWNSPTAAVQSLQEDILRGLRDLGHLPGKTIIVEFHSAEGNPARLPTLVSDLVRRKVDVIVAPSTAVAKLAQDMTKAIPIVIIDVADPVGLGLVASLGRPGGNVTGISSLIAELNAKRLELLKETVPRLSLVAVFMTRGNPLAAVHRRDAEMAERALALKVDHIELDSPAELDRAVAAAAKRRVNAVLVLAGGGDPLLYAHRRHLIETATKRGLATVGGPDHATDGAVIGYGPRNSDIFSRSAVFIDKILKGTKPADLPVEQPTKFELVINLKTAKVLGLTIPQSMLFRADRVIE